NEQNAGKARKPNGEKVLGGEGQHLAPAARERVTAELRERGQVLTGRLVLLVLEQPPDELLARIRPGFAIRRIERLLRRQQHARFDVRQRRRHHQVLAGEIEVQRAGDLHVLQVLVGDERDGDVEDVELVLLDERQQQVEGS